MFRFAFEARIKPGCTEAQYLEAWRVGSAIIQREPGAMGTRLHRQAPGVLIAIATWESKKSRDAAMVRLGLDQEGDPNAVLHRHQRFADLMPLFGLEEIGAVDPLSN
jgi:hypothetical protein